MVTIRRYGPSVCVIGGLQVELFEKDLDSLGLRVGEEKTLLAEVDQRARAEAAEAEVARLTKRLEEVVPTVMATTCRGCDYGVFPHCKEAAGLACSHRLTAERIWDALHLADAKGEGDGWLSAPEQ